MSFLLSRSALLLGAFLALTSAAAYTNTESRFSATAPGGWKQASYPGTTVVFLAPRVVSAFNPNINVLVQDLPGGMTLKAYTDLSVPQIKQFITDSRILTQNASTLGGVPARQLTYTGRQGQHQLFFAQTYAVVGQRAYVLTGTTVQGQEAALLPVMAEFIKQFRFMK